MLRNCLMERKSKRGRGTGKEYRREHAKARVEKGVGEERRKGSWREGESKGRE